LVQLSRDILAHPAEKQNYFQPGKVSGTRMCSSAGVKRKPGNVICGVCSKNQNLVLSKTKRQTLVCTPCPEKAYIFPNNLKKKFKIIFYNFWHTLSQSYVLLKAFKTCPKNLLVTKYS